MYKFSGFDLATFVYCRVSGIIHYVNLNFQTKMIKDKEKMLMVRYDELNVLYNTQTFIYLHTVVTVGLSFVAMLLLIYVVIDGFRGEVLLIALEEVTKNNK